MLISEDQIMPLNFYMWFRSLGQEDSLEEDMATHASILAW